MPYFANANVRIAYRWDGPAQGPVLMLSHSLGADSSMWDAQMPALTRTFRVLRYDARGHGASDVPAGPYTMTGLARDALALLDGLALERVRFCGLSMGGMVGMWLAANVPARIERLVLANTSSHIGSPELWNSRIEAVRRGGMAAITETVLGRWFTPGFAAAQPEALVPIRKALLATAPEGYAACSAAIRDMDQRELLAGIAAPTLVICGRQDPATPTEHGRYLSEHVKSARRIELDAAHLSNIEAAAEFTAALQKFLIEGSQ